MTTRSHEEHRESIGAYLLGALPPLEAEAFERHLAGCPECARELETLRVATDALPRSVEPLEPPPELKAALMEVVYAEAADRPKETAPRRRWFPALPRLARLSPAAAMVSATVLLALGALAGWGIAALSGEDERTVVAQVDDSRLPGAGGELEVHDDVGVLELHGVPPQPGRVMQVWLQRGEEVVPSTVFAARSDGTAVAAIPDDLDGVDRVMVTRERVGGATTPGEPPPVVVEL
jgi:anti-sigma-K factor RskA